MGTARSVQTRTRPGMITVPRVLDGGRTWRERYARRLVVTDVLVLLWAVLGAAAITTDPREPVVSGGTFERLDLSYGLMAVVLVVIWLTALAAYGSRNDRRIGTGSSEFKAVGQATFAVLVALALVSFAFRAEFSRGFVALALMAGLSLLLVERLLWRVWLRLHRRRGDFCARVVLVGSAQPVESIAAELRRHPQAGYHVVGAVVTGGGTLSPAGASVEILAESGDDLMGAVERGHADTVVVTDGHSLDPARLRELSWSLEPGKQHLVMAPSLTDIAGPRIHARPVAGLPLVHVETPRYEGADRFTKRAFDIAVSGGLLLLGSIPLAVVAITVLVTSPGGLFYAQERIGKRGEPFRMLKFRSMVPDADARLQALLEEQGTADSPLFKVKNDPRITPIGRFLRRYSIDEVPQLVNVLKGDMSLVGPRPQVAREVALYDEAAARRLFVKPGMTGLWQVSGRSNLDWEESLRLDLFYVQNWSMVADLQIIMRTVRAVVGSDGAY